MRSTAVDSEALRYLTPVREFTLLNSTDEPIVLQFDGETRVLPPVDVIIKPHPQYDDVCCSALDEDGDYIPGTLVLKDVYEDRAFGAFMDGKMHWSAASAIKHCLEIDVATGEANGKYAKKGVSVLPPNPSKALVAKINSEGQDRYLEWKVQEARDIVETYGAQQAAFQKVGMAAPPPGRDYERALKILKLTGAKESSRLEEIFKDKLAPEEAAQAKETQEEVAGLSELIARKVQEALGRAGQDPVAPESVDLVEAVKNDPEALRKIEHIIRMRKAREAKKNAPGV